MVCPFLGTLQGNVHFVFHVCGSPWMSISKVSEKYFGKSNGMHKLKFGANKLWCWVLMLVCGSIITMQEFLGRQFVGSLEGFFNFNISQGEMVCGLKLSVKLFGLVWRGMLRACFFLFWKREVNKTFFPSWSSICCVDACA